MRTSPPSASEPSSSPPCSAFSRLAPGLQRWIWKQGWTTLRPVQERAIELILDADGDVLIGAPTAGGKTEAAFLPILTRLAALPAPATCIAISPLKALINDQYDRLTSLGEAVDVPVHRWHGDVPDGQKQRFVKQPSGVLLITPESLEAHLVRRGNGARALFGSAAYFVVDELHAFMGNERGRQLQSLLSRLGAFNAPPVPRVALSATLGDMALAAEFLRPGGAERVQTINDAQQGSAIRLLLRGSRERELLDDDERPLPRPSDSPAAPGAREPDAPRGVPASEPELEQPLPSADQRDLARYLFKILRGKNHLVFANSRHKVELFADQLGLLSEQARVPLEFWPHHGNLSKDLREDAEAKLKRGTTPATLIATTTLELGIDVGHVASVVQIGNPPSVASMRQRLGRSGRRGGEAAVLRTLITEPDLHGDSSPQDALRAQTFQAVAMVQLMLDRWIEPPDTGALDLSTLVQQLLSAIAQHGGLRADRAHALLCRDGPFRSVGREPFVELLRALGSQDILCQTGDGALVLGVKGERLVDHYEFYAAFFAPKEFQIRHRGRTLGSLPVTSPVSVGSHIVFAGRRWTILHIEAEARLIDVDPARGGRPPTFDGAAAPVHDRVRAQMRAVYLQDTLPSFADPVAQAFITEGREFFRSARLGDTSLLAVGETTYLFPWVGDRTLLTIEQLLAWAGLRVENERVVLAVHCEPDELLARVERLLAGPTPSGIELASQLASLEIGKYDLFLPRSLQVMNYASSRFDLTAALASLRRILDA